MPPNQFEGYVADQQKRIGSAEFLAARRYWLNQLKSAPPVLNLATDRSRPAVKTYAGFVRSGTIEADIYNQIKRVGAAHDGDVDRT